MREFSWRPWARLARHVHCRYIAGTHLGAITTHVAELARLPDDLLCPQQVDILQGLPMKRRRHAFRGRASRRRLLRSRSTLDQCGACRL